MLLAIQIIDVIGHDSATYLIRYFTNNFLQYTTYDHDVLKCLK